MHSCYTGTLIVCVAIVYHCCSVRADSDCHAVLRALSVRHGLMLLIAVVGGCAMPRCHPTSVLVSILDRAV
jgi:hypothetical protein